MFRAWIIWLLSALFMCYKYAIEVSPSVMTTHLMSEFNLSGAEMGNLAATYFYAYLIMQIPAGLLIDRWGPRRVTTIAIFLCGVGAWIFSIADSFFLACLGRFITGVGAAFAAVNCLKLIANWFPAKQFALMAGLMMTVGMLGAVCGQAPLSQFIAALGWRMAISDISMAGLILSAVFLFVVRDKAPHHREVDLMPAKPNVFKNLKSVLRNPQSWYLSFYSGLAFGPVSAFGGLWGVPFLNEAFGFTMHDAAQGASLIFLGFGVGAPILGWYSDKIGKRKPVMFWGTLVATIALCAILYGPITSHEIVYALLFILGFSISSFLLCFTMMKETHNVVLAATSMGFMNAFDALFGAFSDPLTGKVLDLWWTGTMAEGARTFSVSAYHCALAILFVYFIASLVMIKPIKETHCKQAYPSGLP
ncbi:MAG: MFS transporter [Verrucomicrobia bacterium]|nr:MFS transporter [Verrucomicrobiota bacterium]